MKRDVLCGAKDINLYSEYAVPYRFLKLGQEVGVLDFSLSLWSIEQNIPNLNKRIKQKYRERI